MKTVATKEQYEAAWKTEVANAYAAIDAYERVCGYAVDLDWLNGIARILNCPVKVNPPNWQHGRVLYAALRKFLESNVGLATVKSPRAIIDIGTAKGFSASVMARALYDHGVTWMPVYTVDVIDPDARVIRNTVAEVDGLKTLYEVLDPTLPAGVHVQCYGRGSRDVLERLKHGGYRIPFAFVDGKHSFDAVKFEGVAIAMRQQAGDMVIFDDCQLPEVRRAVEILNMYEVSYLQNGPRTYAIARRL